MAKSTPEISLNKLAEFVNASPARKKSILRTIQSTEADAASSRNRYSSAKSALVRYLVDKEHKISIFLEKRELLLGKKAESDQQRNDVKNSLEAIRVMEKFIVPDLKPYLQFKSERSRPELRTIMINGICLHLSPDLLFIDQGKIVGGIKLIFSKKAISPMEGQIIAGLLARTLTRKYKANIKNANCFALDIFAHRIHPVPDSFKLHLRMLRKTYSEINKLWLTATT